MKALTLFTAMITLWLTACADPATVTRAQDPDPTDATPAMELQTLKGTYSDPTSYPYGSAYGKRVFTFNEGQWSLKFVLALDPELTQPVFEFRTRGSYQIQAPSKAVPGAYEADFSEDVKLLTLKTDNAQLVEAFGLAACALPLNQEVDISIKGCSGWKPVSVCPTDHDLLALTDDGALQFGQRPMDNDMCTAAKRPTALTPAVRKM